MARLWLFPTDTPWPWPTPARAANARGGESPTLAEQRSGTERAKRSGGLHKRSAEDCGIPLACARSRAPQEGLVTLLSARRRRRSIFRVALRQEQAVGMGSRKSKGRCFAGLGLEQGRGSFFPHMELKLERRDVPEGFLLVKTVRSFALVAALFLCGVPSLYAERAGTSPHPQWDNALLWAAGFIGHIALMLVLIIRKRWRDFPVFTAFVGTKCSPLSCCLWFGVTARGMVTSSLTGSLDSPTTFFRWPCSRKWRATFSVPQERGFETHATPFSVGG